VSPKGAVVENVYVKKSPWNENHQEILLNFRCSLRDVLISRSQRCLFILMCGPGVKKKQTKVSGCKFTGNLHKQAPLHTHTHDISPPRGQQYSHCTNTPRLKEAAKAKNCQPY
jgi:hypothetical protein